MFSIVAFKTLDISQGSVATHVRCGGIFSDSIITCFLLIQTVKNYENRLIFGKVKPIFVMPIFGSPCILHDHSSQEAKRPCLTVDKSINQIIITSINS